MPHKDPSEHRPHKQRHKAHVHIDKPRVIQKIHIDKPKVIQKSPKIPTLLRLQSSEGRRFIQELWKQYKGEEFWILGTGPSMDDYPDDFFDDKISIGLKSNVSVFPNTTFHFSTMGPHKSKVLQQPDVLKKHIFGLRTQKPRFRDWVPKKYRQFPVYMWQCRINVRWPAHRKLLIEGINRSMRKQAIRHPHEDSVSHLAIQAATIMGAKKITLVGCEEKCVEHRIYANRYRPFYGRRRFCTTDEKVKRFWESAYRQRKGTRILAQAVKRHGVEVALFHLKDSEQYKAGYLKVS